VAAAAGQHLLCFEVGNEPDLFVPQGHRRAGYGYVQFLDEFHRFAAAVRKRVPGAAFAGPDVAMSPDWVARFARDAGVPLRLLTEHYYAAGPPDNPNATIGNLLKLDPNFIDMTRQLRAASQASGIPYRLVEVNSCFGGGKPGMSDTFASALWGLDLMFTLADAGGAGINWETGVNHLGTISSYSPIWDDERGHYSARPLYYALLAFSLCGMGQRYPVKVEAPGLNLRAWGVVRTDGQVWLTLINKDLSSRARVTLQPGRKFESAQMMKLEAPDYASRNGVALGGSEVTPAGTWKPGKTTPLPLEGAVFKVELMPASAALIRLF
jgi:hypothetical protein